jgi:hypothetical protein
MATYGVAPLITYPAINGQNINHNVFFTYTVPYGSYLELYWIGAYATGGGYNAPLVTTNLNIWVLQGGWIAPTNPPSYTITINTYQKYTIVGGDTLVIQNTTGLNVTFRASCLQMTNP